MSARFAKHRVGTHLIYIARQEGPNNTHLYSEIRVQTHQ